MRLRVVILLTGSLLAGACQSRSDSSGPPAAPQAPPAAPTPPPGTPQPKLLHAAAARHLFSSRTAPDQFRLELRGDSLLTGAVRLSIVAASGDTLLKEQFPAQALLDYGLLRYGPTPTYAQREAYVRERIDQFFADKQFRDPAIGPQEQFVARQSDRAIWGEVKQTGLPGFFYTLYEEDGRGLAYSPRQRRAVVFRRCC